MRRTTLAAAFLVVLVGACGDDSSDELRVTDVWSRASATSQLTGVVYFDITAGDSGDALLGVRVSADIAGSAGIHETVAVDTSTTMAGHDMGGGMTMQPVSSVHVSGGDTVSFEPGGYHVMLMGLVKPLEVGQTFEVTLVFEHAGELVVTAEVRE
ncbi:MAG TPA: copper chaperone PCu(A)C [Acidimicrobiia bacterium]|nr:copper chaperone PCu(A)C [Acidimicrobiia bacterium]